MPATGTARLLATVGLLSAIWLVLLPWLSARQPVAAQLQLLDEHGVNPSAMYYTELEMMQPVLARMALEKRKPRN